MFNNFRKRPYRVAIEGFSDFERSALASFFRLAERRVPAYVQVDSFDAADFLVVDADQQPRLDQVARERRVRDAVFVGATAPGEALAWLGRPIDPVHILRELDRLLGARLAHDRPATPADFLDTIDSSSKLGAAFAPKRRPNPTARPRGGGDRPVLVADDSPIARAFLARRLREHGYRVTLAASGEEALAAAAHQAYVVVFLDIDFGARGTLDGLQVCQQIKQLPTPPEGRVPAIVITTGSNGATDRVQGSLAGCDAYLTKPLHEVDFTAALHRVDPLFGWVAAPKT